MVSRNPTIAGHPGHQHMYDTVPCNFYSIQMATDVDHIVAHAQAVQEKTQTIAISIIYSSYQYPNHTTLPQWISCDLFLKQQKATSTYL